MPQVTRLMLKLLMIAEWVSEDCALRHAFSAEALDDVMWTATTATYHDSVVPLLWDTLT